VRKARNTGLAEWASRMASGAPSVDGVVS